jgi:integrase/recombinase XerD
MPARGSRKPPRPIGDPADPDGMGRAVMDHLAFRASLGQSEATLLLGRRELGYFVAWCAERDLTKPVQVTRSVLERYRKWLSLYRQPKDGRPLALSSQRDRMCFVLLFFRWLAKQNRILINPGSEVELPLADKRLPEVLTVAEVERVINQPDVTMALGVRDRAALETLYSTGMRRMELCGLDVRDVDLEQGLVRIRRGKGRKDRVIPIGARAVMWIRKYLDDVRPALAIDESEPALFLTRFGHPFSLSHMTTLCLAYKRAAGVEKRGSCHLFRHTAATQMLDNGADTRHIQAMLGHDALVSTQVYTKVAIRKLKEVHTATHPSAKLGKQATSAAADDEPDAAPRPPCSPGEALKWLRRSRNESERAP